MRFSGLSDDELADIWDALAGAEIRHPDCFKALLDDSIKELEWRKGKAVREFLDARFAKLRGIDAPEDIEANRKSTSGCDPAVDN